MSNVHASPNGTRPAPLPMRTIGISKRARSTGLERRRASPHLPDGLPVTALHCDEFSGRAAVVFIGEKS